MKELIANFKEKAEKGSPILIFQRLSIYWSMMVWFSSWNNMIFPVVLLKRWRTFFYQGFFSQTLTIHRTAREGRGSCFYSTLPLPPAHEHSDISLQLCMWDDYHVFLIATLVFTRLLLDEIFHLIELPFDWLIDWLIDDRIFAFLLDELILGIIAIWHEKTVDLSSHRLSLLLYKRIN